MQSELIRSLFANEKSAIVMPCGNVKIFHACARTVNANDRSVNQSLIEIVMRRKNTAATAIASAFD